MKSIYMCLHSFEGQILNFTFRRFYSKWLDHYDDIVPLGYIALLEHKDDYENIEEENKRFWKAVSYCSAGMQKFFDNSSFGYIKKVSLTDLTERHIEKYLFYNTLEEYEKLTIMKDLFDECLFSCSSKDKNIIFDYFFNGMLKSNIYKKYNIHNKYLKALVLSVRQDYFNKLVEFGLINERDIQTNFSKDFQKVEKQKDVKICSLLKSHKIPIEDISMVTGVPVEKVPKILMRTNGKLSFFLYQIQKLRKCYFPQYTLQELAV